MRIAPATPADLPAAAACMAAAFSNDPVTGAFFHDSPIGRAESTARFFAMLFDARIALGMPALVARDGDRVGGLVMGYDTTGSADWPVDVQARWEAFEALHPGLPERFETYETLVNTFRPVGSPYVLGALGVDPAYQGKGLGRALVEAFLNLSDGDPASTGTILETGTPSNLDFYRRLGFEVTGAGPLGSATLWCMFRPKPTPRISRTPANFRNEHPGQ